MEEGKIKLLKIREVAEMLGVHPETLRRWDREGTLKAIIINKRGDRRYKETDVMEFIKNNKSTESQDVQKPNEP